MARIRWLSKPVHYELYCGYKYNENVSWNSNDLDIRVKQKFVSEHMRSWHMQEQGRLEARSNLTTEQSLLMPFVHFKPEMRI
jgi:hypothetical protein